MWGLFSSFSYSDEWKSLEKISGTNPKTALSKLDAIEKQAQKEKNYPQQLRCILKRNEYKSYFEEVDPKSTIDALDSFRKETNDDVARSVATLFIAKNYYSYFQRNRYMIRQRTDLQDVLPDDIREWTTVNFQQQIRLSIFDALKKCDKIKSVKSEDYGAVVDLGSDSRLYRPTLYDLFLSEAMEMQTLDETHQVFSQEERDDFYKKWLAFHEKDEERDAFVKIKLQIMEDRYEGKWNRDTYISELEAFLEEMKAERSSILIRIDLCQELENMGSVNWGMHSALPQRIIDICQAGIDAFPKHDRVWCLKAMVERINLVSFDVRIVNDKPHSNDPIRLGINYANITHLDLTLSRIDETPQMIAEHRYDWKPKMTKVKDISVDLEKTNYCVKRDTVVEIPPLPYGYYRITYGKGKEMRQMDFAVSDLFYLHTSDDEIAQSFVVVDGKSGAPKKGVSIAGKGEWQAWKGETDEQGFARLDGECGKSQREQKLYFEEGKDRYLSPFTYYYGYYQERKKGVRLSDNAGDYCSIMTDRSIYRPSQTVYYKVIFYHLGKDDLRVRPDHEANVVLRDANYQVVAEQRVKSNEFGSAASSFTLPANGLSGNYHIEVDGRQQYFSVEEYKRPTFEVSLTRPKESFSFGDNIVVKGHAGYLLGTPLTQAKVEYHVTRKPCYWWWYYGEVEASLVEGETSVDDMGDFEVPFLALKPESDRNLSYYSYEIYVKVTDANGETHDQRITLSVGDRSLYFTSSLKDRTLMKDLSSAKFVVANLNGEGQVVEVSYEVKREDVVVAQGSVVSDKEGVFVIKDDTKTWTSGAYKFELKAKDEKGREVTASYETVLYREDEKRPPVETIFWKENIASVSLPYGEKYRVRVGSSLKGANLLVIEDDERGGSERRWIQLNDEIMDLTFSLEQNNGEVKMVRFYMVYDGRLYSEEMRIRKKEESRSVPMQLAVFRDKMLPGSKETWTISVPKEMEVEVLAAMYDASLDLISSHDWHSISSYFRNVGFKSWDKCSWTKGSFNYYGAESYHFNASWFFDRFIDVNGRKYGGRMRYAASNGFAKMGQPGADPVLMVMDDAIAVEESAVADMDESAIVAKQAAPMSPEPEENGAESPSADAEEVKVRSNFAETAFFYPQLYADKDGNVQLSFEMPESLTRWNFMALAHTKNLSHGSLAQSVVTQKDFMVSPNLPRFMRRGDRCVLSAKVINLSEKGQSGKAKVQLLDPLSERVLLEENAKFEVEAGKDVAVSWSLDVPRGLDAVLVRVTAVAKDFSDAEQSLLPILSDRMVVTQSLPLYVRGGQTKEYTFDKLVENKSNTLSTRFLKLEFATNPIWYAVQALPSTAVVEHENAISYSAAHFSALMSEHIAKSNPKIFNIIELWKQQGKDKETLLSNLEKNQDVKNVLLNESPWVMDAKNETEMKQRLSTLFDVNDLKEKSRLWFDKMSDFRLSEGGYTWFHGFYPSRHITLFVLDNLGRLRKAGIADNALLDKAQYRASLSFLDRDVKREYDDLRRYHPKDYKKVAYVDASLLYYFQVRSLFPEVSLVSDAKEAHDFYYGLIKEQWKGYSLYMKALAAIVAHRGGDKALAKSIVESLREFSTTTDEMGMFWQKNENGYFWHNAAISTHTRIMEALEVVDPKQAEQDELRLWLLNQKRTQNWGNTIANVDALNVLLLSGSDWLSNDNQVSVKMGGEEVRPETTEAGTGYFTHIVESDRVKPSMGHVELSSAQGGNISWGALYWQFEEDIDKVWKNKTGLHVEKMVMKEVREAGKPVLKTINEKSTLKVGDKLVVRLTLRTDRDMDYVSLKDQRAGCLEPIQQFSGYCFREGTGYYQSPKDAAMYYFFDHLAKGTYVFEYPLWVTHAGDYCNGITSVQCLYAPEFSSNTSSVRIMVGE